MAVKDFIVAIELGSSKITGIAGRKDTDGSLQVLAIVQEPSSGFIKKGVIYNIEKTAACLTSIVNKLQNILQAKIGKVYVGISGQSVHSVLNVVNRNLDTETIVDEEIIDSIKEENILTPYSDMEIIDIIPQEYRVGNDRQVDPIGILTNVVEGNFLNILARTSVRSKIKQCFQKANIEIAEVVVSPIALADAVLTDQEKRSGCALVDFGADTTTVAVYNGNILRHLVVIPIGGHNVTKDICSLQIEESEAEQLKKKYGSAFTPLDKMDDTRTYPIHDDRIVEAKQLNKIVEARMMEIISNVWFQIGEGIVYEKLLAGVVITGGGANMSDLQLAFTDRTKFEKLIPMRFVDFTVKGNQPEIEAKDGCMNTVLGILYKGEVNCCAGDLIVTTGDLFTDESEDTHGKAPVCDAQTKVEKEIQEQEAKRKALAEENERKATEEAERLAAEEKIRLEEERKEKERIRQEKREAWKKNNIFSRTATALKNFSKRMIDED